MAFTKVVGAGIHTLSNITSHNINSSGIITATKFVGPIEGNITAVDGVFTGNVSIAKTLTYEDVKNVDSVGVGTFREGVFIPDQKILRLGNTASNPDFKFEHNSANNNTIFSETGDLHIHARGNGDFYLKANDDIFIKPNGGGEEGIRVVGGDAVQLYHANNKRAETLSNGFQTQHQTPIFQLFGENASGTRASNGYLNFYLRDGNSNNYSVARVLGATDNSNGGYGCLQFQTAFANSLSTKMIITREGNVGIGSENPSAKLDLIGDAKLQGVSIAGVTTASQGLRVPHGSATSNYISVGDGGTLRIWGTGHQFADIRAGNLHFRNGSLQNILELQQDKDIWMYGPIYVEDTARFSQTVTIADTITHQGDTDTKIRFPAADQIQFETAGTSWFNLGSTGAFNLGNNSNAGTKVYIKNSNVDANNSNALALDIQGAWIRIGDAILGNQTYTNGIGIKFHNSGVAHHSISAQGADLYFSTTSNNGNQLWPSSRTDSLRLTGAGAAIFAGDITAGGNLYIPDRIYHVGDTNTQIRFPANDTITFETNGSERLRIDSSGRLLIGTTASRTTNSHTPALQISGTNYHKSTVQIISNSNDSTGAYLFFGKQRSGSSGGNTIAQNGDIVGQLRFSIADGTDMENQCAQIEARVDGTPGSNDTPGRLQFYTTPDGSTTLTERLRITSSGNIKLPDNAKIELGGAQTGSGDLQIFHQTSGSVNQIQSTAGNSLRVRQLGNGGSLYLAGTNIYFQNHDNNQTYLQAQNNGQVILNHSGNARAYTAADGFALSRVNTFPNPNNTGSEITGAMLDIGGNLHLEERYPAGAYVDRQDLVLRFNTGYGLGMSDKFRFTSGGGLIKYTTGQVLFGLDASRTINSHAPQLQITGTAFSHSTVSIVSNTNANDGAYLFLAKQRSGAVGGSTAVQANDLIGELRFNAGDGTDMENYAARMIVHADANASSNNTPGRFDFYTTRRNGSSNHKLRITQNSNHSSVFSMGTGDSTHLNNASTPDRTSVKIGGLLHLEGPFGHNATPGMYYNCYSGGNDLFYRGTGAPSGGDRRPAAYGQKFGGHYFYGDNSSTAWSAQQQITSMQLNMYVGPQGHVTKPQQPRAFVKVGGNITLGNGKVTNWASPMYNVGSLWDTTNKRFVAPANGLYMIGGNFRIGAPGKIRVVRFEIRAYNSSGGHMATYGSGFGGTHNYDGGSSGYDHPYVSFTNVVYLEAAQYLELWLAETSTEHTSYIQDNNEQSHLWCVLLQ